MADALGAPCTIALASAPVVERPPPFPTAEIEAVGQALLDRAVFATQGPRAAATRVSLVAALAAVRPCLDIESRLATWWGAGPGGWDAAAWGEEPPGGGPAAPAVAAAAPPDPGAGSRFTLIMHPWIEAVCEGAAGDLARVAASLLPARHCVAALGGALAAVGEEGGGGGGGACHASAAVRIMETALVGARSSLGAIVVAVALRQALLVSAVDGVRTALDALSSRGACGKGLPAADRPPLPLAVPPLGYEGYSRCGRRRAGREEAGGMAPAEHGASDLGGPDAADADATTDAANIGAPHLYNLAGVILHVHHNFKGAVQCVLTEVTAVAVQMARREEGEEEAAKAGSPLPSPATLLVRRAQWVLEILAAFVEGGVGEEEGAEETGERAPAPPPDPHPTRPGPEAASPPTPPPPPPPAVLPPPPPDEPRITWVKEGEGATTAAVRVVLNLAPFLDAARPADQGRRKWAEAADVVVVVQLTAGGAEVVVVVGLGLKEETGGEKKGGRAVPSPPVTLVAALEAATARARVARVPLNLALDAAGATAALERHPRGAAGAVLTVCAPVLSGTALVEALVEAAGGTVCRAVEVKEVAVVR